eukprot:TRINITY_DN2908_c0_g2_i1.p1 TRINITY_DN2908_c0_g2~~TRINITY_DN2908_c0_g2_i1.p1  ORF type:complete len:594 (-),score=97.79 TRINITY_DN2908_c0_g2_i1:126-1691(-)
MSPATPERRVSVGFDIGGACTEVASLSASRRGALRVLSRLTEEKLGVYPHSYDLVDASGKVDSFEALRRALGSVDASADICELKVHERPEWKWRKMRSVDERLDALTQKGLAVDSAMTEFEARIEAKVEDSLSRLRTEIQENSSQLRQGIVPLVHVMALEQLDLKKKVDCLITPAAPFTTAVPCKSHGIGLPVVERIDVPSSTMARSSRPLRPVPESCTSYGAELPSGCSDIGEVFKEFQEQCTGAFKRLGEAAKIEDTLGEKVEESLEALRSEMRCLERRLEASLPKKCTDMGTVEGDDATTSRTGQDGSSRRALAPPAMMQLPSGCSDIDEIFKDFQDQCSGAFERWGEAAKREDALDEKVQKCSHRAASAQEGLEALQSEVRELEQRLEASFAKKCAEGLDATTSRMCLKSTSRRVLTPAEPMQDEKERLRRFQDHSLGGVPFSSKADSLFGISYSAKDTNSLTSGKCFGVGDAPPVSQPWSGALSLDVSGEYSGPLSRRRALPGLRCKSLPQLVPQL